MLEKYQRANNKETCNHKTHAPIRRGTTDWHLPLPLGGRVVVVVVVFASDEILFGGGGKRRLRQAT